MTAQEYITLKLQALQKPTGLVKPQGQEDLEDTIFRLLMSKKFRKYSVIPEYVDHIKKSININVQNDQPIKIAFLGGCYKLWRLEEAPESDWAELFTAMYYTQWLKPICEIYPPGVWFDFFLDDIVVPKLNNIPEADVEIYRESRQKVLDFLKPYRPSNLNMTLSSVGAQFSSKQAFEESLKRNMEKLSTELPGGLPKLSESAAATTSLNVRATPEQEADHVWREKVELMHSAYLMSKAETGYANADTLDKIRAFTQPLGSGTSISVGTTKDSIAKFWVGVGVLARKEDDFRQIILSPKQLSKASFSWEDVRLKNLIGKNFSKIRILN